MRRGGVTMRPGSRLSGTRRSNLRTSCFCPAICPWPETTVNYSRILPGLSHCREPKCSRPGTTTPGGTALSESARCCADHSAVGGDALEVGGVIVCGTRGVGPASDGLPPEQQAVIDHEVGELERGLELATRLRTSREQPLYVLWHYPPFDAYGRPGPWVTRFEETGVSACVYGHLHMQGQWSRAVQGSLRGVRYYCVAADAVGFRPLRIDLC